MLEQSFHALSEVSPRYLLRCTMDIAFCGEEGIDSGGLTREWSIPTHTYIHTYIYSQTVGITHIFGVLLGTRC